MKKPIYIYSCALLIVIIISITIIISDDKEFAPGITEKSPYDKVNDVNGVFLRTSENTYTHNIKEITVIFQNDTSNEYIFGIEYHLEKLENNEWYQLSEAPSEYERCWTDEGYILNPNSKRNETVKLEWIYGDNFEPGKYRIIKDIIFLRRPGDYDKFYLTAEFDITE